MAHGAAAACGSSDGGHSSSGGGGAQEGLAKEALELRARAFACCKVSGWDAGVLPERDQGYDLWC
jgi:hypothetical protein